MKAKSLGLRHRSGTEKAIELKRHSRIDQSK
jgi:hypothetical protein